MPTSSSVPSVQSLGDLLFIGFDGTELTVDLREFLLAVRPGGIILFKRNILDAHQTLRLIAGLKGIYEPAPIIAVDEEGGQVSRLRPLAPTLPPMARLAASHNTETVRQGAAALGGVLSSLGFDMDFAPVVDLCRPDAPNGIGDRSFGLDPEAVASLAGAYLDGLAEAGIVGCLKHFPGLGPTLFDSHYHVPSVTKAEAAFRAEDLLPYQRLHSRVPVIMIGHGHYPFFAGPDPIAATLTPAVSTGLLRETIGFCGVALADDLEMKAVAARMSWSELAPRVIAAGCDMALVCRNRDAIGASLRALGEWVSSFRLDPARVTQALDRVVALRQAVAAAAARRNAPSDEAFHAACAVLSERVAAIG